MLSVDIVLWMLLRCGIVGARGKQRGSFFFVVVVIAVPPQRCLLLAKKLYIDRILTHIWANLYDLNIHCFT